MALLKRPDQRARPDRSRAGGWNVVAPAGERSFTIVNVRSPAPDRTARAAIRDEALRLFAQRGANGVSVREVAAAAGVSPALVIRHYGTKEGLREAVDEHVVATLEAMLGALVGAADPAALPSLAEAVLAKLPRDSDVPRYLGRLLLDGRPAGSRLFGRLHQVARGALTALSARGLATTGADPEVRAAVLLVNDLGAILLRERIAEAVGIDPLTPQGMRRWGEEITEIYRNGLGGNRT
jgi:AcrR family transcriptional regulator